MIPLKTIRKAAASGDYRIAMDAFTQYDRMRMVNTETIVLTLQALVRSGQIPIPELMQRWLSDLSLLPKVLPVGGGPGDAKGPHMPRQRRIQHHECFELIAIIPQSVRDQDGAAFVEALIDASEFPDDTTPNARTYARRQCRLLVLEHLHEAQTVRESTMTMSQDYMIRGGRCLTHLQVEANRSAKKKKPNGISFGIQYAQAANSKLDRGDSVAFCTMEEAPLQTFCEGDIVDANREQIVVKFRCQHIWEQLNRKSRYFRCDRYGNRIVFGRQILAIEILSMGIQSAQVTKSKHKTLSLPHPSLLRAVLAPFGRKDDSLSAIVGESRFPSISRRNLEDRVERLQLNRSQKIAAKRAITSRLTLIQGPPGTGKTHVSCTIMREWSRMGFKVLAVAGTNVAADNLVEGLVKRGVSVLRMGKPESIRPELFKYSYDGVDVSTAVDQSERYRIRMRAMKVASVICTTCSGSGSEMLARTKFNVCLCDEATQITETENIMPLCFGVEQLVLIGDHCQLPPTVSSDQAESEGLSQPFFTRLVQNGVTPCLLDTQVAYSVFVCLCV